MQRLSVAKNNELSEALASSFDSANLVKVESKSFSGAQLTAANCNFTGLNGDKDVRYQFVISGVCNSDIFLQFNGDTTASNYYDGYIAQNASSVGATAVSSSARGIRLTAYGSPNIFAIADIDAKTAGKPRMVNSRCTAAGGGTLNGSNNFGAWLNTSANITSIALNQSSGTAFTGTVTLYKWQDVKTVDVASYQLVKEYKLNNQVLNDTIAWDGEADSEVLMLSNYVGTQNILVRLNNDASANYTYSYTDQSGANISAATASSQSAMFGAFQANINSHGRFEANLKAGRVRPYRLLSGRSITTSVNNTVITGFWSNATDPVTTLSLSSNGVTITGSIKLYKLATTQLLKRVTNPIELVLSKTYFSASVNEIIDLSDCEGLTIEASSRTSLSSYVNTLFNNDANVGNYGRRYVQNGISAQDTYLPYLNAVSASPWISKRELDKASRMIVGTMQSLGSGTYYLQDVMFQYGGAEPSTLHIVGTGFTGKIKVYKRY